MASEKISFWNSIIIVLALVSVLWIVQFIQYFGLYDFSIYANHPRHADGIPGIFLSPFVHDAAHFDHIISNTLPILILLTVLINAYPSVAIFVLLFVHITTGVLVWLLAPSTTYHIGISGIIYGIAAFLLASGIFRRNRTSVSIAIMVGFLYGGMIGGFIPKEGVSWQSHLFGAISGVTIAYLLRHSGLPEVTEQAPVKHEDDEHHFFDLHPTPNRDNTE